MKALALAVLLAIPGAPDRAGPEGSAGAGTSARSSPVATAAQDNQPFKRPLQEPLDYRGPGREEPEPDVDEVVLGWFGPGDPRHPEFGDLWRGATLALEEENAAGGYRGKPFRLLAAWSESPWKAGIVDVARLVHERGAWAILGGVDGTTTHLAVQIALKSHFLLLSPGSTDSSTDHANVPWLFSLAPSDEVVAPVLAEAAARATAGGPFAIAASTDHDAHAALVAVRRALATRRLTPASLFELSTVDPDLAALGAQLLRDESHALVVLAPSGVAGRLVAEVRRAGWAGTIVGGATLSRSAFARAAGEAADGVLAWVSSDPATGTAEFAAACERRWGEPPDEAAARGYDAVRLTAAAIRRGGLNRARIRDAVRELAPWPGVSGRVRWNALGRNDGAVRPARWTRGRLVPVD